MRGMEAKKVCPELMLVSVPTTRGKSDTTRFNFFSTTVFFKLIKIDIKMQVRGLLTFSCHLHL